MQNPPRVLIGCPTYEGHSFCIKRFLEALKKISYPNFDVLFVDNSEKEEHAQFIRSHGYEVLRNAEKTADRIDAIIKNRNIIIQRAIEKGYGCLLFLDTDVLVPEDIIEKLLSHDNDIVSGVYLGGQMIKRRMRLAPVIYDFTEKKDYVKHIPVERVLEGDFFEIAACGFGCCLIKREILEKVTLRYNKELGGGEDFPFCKDARDKGYRIFADCTVKCIHMTKEKDLVFPVSVASFRISYDIK